MTNRISRRFFLGGLSALALSSAACAKAPETSLYPQARTKDLAGSAAGGVDALIANAGLSGDLSFAVADVQSGKPLESYKPNAKMPPRAWPRR